MGALVLGWATYRGWRSGRVGLRLFGFIALGHLGFLLLLVPIQDDRFILTLAPAAAIVAATSLHGRALRGALAAMLLVSADAHLWTPAKESGEGNPWPATRDGQTWTPRLGMSSSVDRRGWSRSTDMRATTRQLHARSCGRRSPPAAAAWSMPESSSSLLLEI